MKLSVSSQGPRGLELIRDHLTQDFSASLDLD